MSVVVRWLPSAATAMLARVILDFGSARMRATTVAIDDPGPLERFLPDSGPSTAFIRKGEGFVGLGEAARFETDTLEAADVWWDEISEQIDHDSEMPGEFGTGPIAVGSFTFDPDRSEERSVLTVPQTVIGRRGDVFWMTKLGSEHNSMDLPSRGAAAVAPVNPVAVGGAMGEDVWTRIVGEVVSLIRNDEVSKVVLARDLRIRADEPLDLRWILDRLIRDYPMTWTYLVDGMVGATRSCSCGARAASSPPASSLAPSGVRPRVPTRCSWPRSWRARRRTSRSTSSPSPPWPTRSPRTARR